MDTLDILDFSSKKLKKLNKPTSAEAQVSTLILDDNELQRLDNIDSFSKVEKFSAVRNQLLRMYGVSRLLHLHTLNLAHNKILTIEGLKDLVHLKFLNLAGNDIKTIEHLYTNVNLEHLDLSENAITHITDLSYLKELKELLLHNNKIGHLRQCERFLPTTLVTLTLASNNINDLNEVSQLVNLTKLYSISFSNNPCVVFSGNKVGFDYRPFLINWCLTVQVIDGYAVDAIECLKGEWLYSQGRGRTFRIGDNDELSRYLASVCPLTGEQLETEDDRKLRLILSKAQHHQQQLREQANSPMPSPSVRKKFQPKHSPRPGSRINRSKSPDKMTSSCYSTSSNLTDTTSLMSQSLDPCLLSQTISSSRPHTGDSMSSSTIMNTSTANGMCLDEEPINSPLQALSKLVPVPESLMSPDYRPPNSTRLGSISNAPTPTGCMGKITQSKIAQPVKSPKAQRNQISKLKPNLVDNRSRVGSPSPVRNGRSSSTTGNKSATNTPPMYHKPLISAMKKSISSDEESEMCDAKLQTINMKAEEKRAQIETERSSTASSSEDKAEMAAIFIQKMWRGYYARNINKQVQEAFKTIQAQRSDEYLRKLANDMESTKAALESERKIQMLQIQAINALWKKVSALQPPEGGDASCSSQQSIVKGADMNTELIHNLAQTCLSLQSQMQQLQGSMQDIVKFMALYTQLPGMQQQMKESVAGTQTEIVAVHTPQGEAAKSFPFHKQPIQTRPSSLPLPINQRMAVKREMPAPVTTVASTITTISTSMPEQNQSVSSSDVRQYAGHLVDGVIKTVSESGADCYGVPQTTEITVTDTEKRYSSAEVATEALDVES